MLTYLRQSPIFGQFNRTNLIVSLIFVVCATLFVNFCNVYTPFIIGDIVQFFVDDNVVVATLTGLIILYGALLIASPIASFLSEYILDLYAARLKDKLRRTTFADLMHHDAAQNKFGDGSMLTVWTRGIDAVMNSLDHLVFHLTIPILSLIFSFSALVIGLHHYLLYVVLVAVSAYALWLVYAKAQIEKKYARYNKAEERVTQLSLDLVRHRSVFQIFGARFRLGTDFGTASTENLEADKELLRMDMIWRIGNRIILACTLIASLIVVIHLISQNILQAGDIVVTAALMRNLFGPVRQINNALHQLKKEQVRAQTLAELLNLATNERANREARKPLEDISVIQVHNLGVAYDENTIFEGLDTQISIGENYYIKGPSGAGKSSFVKILSAQQSPSQGTISFIDTDGKTHELKTVLPAIAYASQDDALFNLSLKDNVTLGIDDNAKFEKALALAGFSNQLKQRLQNGDPLGENGAFLSGGERKRVMLARSIFHAQKLIILDETLANLDQQSAEKILQNLSALKDITLILVSHNEALAPQTSFGIISLPA